MLSCVIHTKTKYFQLKMINYELLNFKLKFTFGQCLA